MHIFIDALNFFLHIDKHLASVIQTYGAVSYALLFLVIFMETGLVVTPFLPGDSLLFAAGALAATGSFNIGLLFVVLYLAAVLGDTANYWIGHAIGPKAFDGKIKLLKKEHLEKTHEYFAKYGGKTIIIGRFIPIVRTFAPFVAGVGAMSYGQFILYNLVGGLIWVALFTFGGFFFGNIPIVKNNFSVVIVVIIAISVVPAVIEYLKEKHKKAPVSPSSE
jgi:membrane-associated protein